MSKAGKATAAVAAFFTSILFIYPADTAEIPEWYSSAVFYEIFVRSFADSDGDGTGDLKGIAERLDYLNDGSKNSESSLGVNALWLTPIFSSPSYHGYDVTDYRKIDEELGSLSDFRNLIDECRKRGIRVILDLPVNHTSDLHPWFIESCGDEPDNPYRDWYVWKKEMPDSWRRPWDASGNSSDVWHRHGDRYYYGLFWRGMPDLNFTNQEVKKEIKDIAAYWLDSGVDGFRIDAARYFIETGPAGDQADTLQTLEWLREFNDFVKSRNPNAVIVVEAWADMEITARYVQGYKAADTAFNFDLASAMIGAAATENPHILKSSYKRTNRLYAFPFVDSIFLTNHDQNRTGSRLTQIHERKTAASMLLTLRGTPFLYYGEEIGMTGVKPDPNIRKFFCWDSQSGPHCDGCSLMKQQKSKKSLWHHYRKLIGIRRSVPALSSKRLEWLNAEPSGYVCAFRRGDEENGVIVVMNFDDRKRKVRLYGVDWLKKTKKVKDLYSNRSITVKIEGKEEGVNIGKVPAGGIRILSLN